MTFSIYSTNESILIENISGEEIARIIYIEAKDLADLIGENLYLVDGETGEVLDSTEED